ncbi:MAG: hypothetical protein PHF86_08660 [Candidatus Nanoarchaeia archaeon]|jgi:hypothetical protein|nr:hypothetical protein [Candidatus Nanoarchaeia archaeon]
MQDFAKFLTAQIHAIDKSVYLASEKENFDLRYDYDGKPSEQYFLQWVDVHASGFKNAWETSLCKTCKKVSNCYDCLRDSCPSFENSD